MSPRRQTEPWYRRNVAVAGFIFTLVMHGGSCVWFGAKLSAATERNTADVVALKDAQKDLVPRHEFEEAQKNTSDRLSDINSKLDILLSRGTAK